jgi:transposase
VTERRRDGEHPTHADDPSRADVIHQRDQALARVRELEEENAALRVQLAEALKLVELQRADLDRFKKAYEAARPNHPERAPRDQLQLAFERVLETLGVELAANDADGAEEAADGQQTADPAGERGKKSNGRHSHGRRPLDLSNLPRIEQKLVPDEVLADPDRYVLIGSDTSDRLARRFGGYVLYRLVRQKYVLKEDVTAAQDVPATDTAGQAVVADGPEPVPAQGAPAVACSGAATPNGDESREAKRVIIAPLPESLWPNVMADPSAIAHVIVRKYGDLLPLNRQQTIGERDGFVMPKSTQCGWLKPAAAYCMPVVDAMMADGKRNAFLIATDATSASVLPERRPAGAPHWATAGPGERRKCDTWHVFVFIADRDHVVFRYDREHSGAVFARMLAGYHGNVLADAASVFDVLYRDHGMTENCCWFHARRPFYRALESDPHRALEALSIIGKLFEVDGKLREQKLDLDSFTRRRAERSRPILKLLDDWVALHRDRVDPRGPLDSAIGYYLNQRDALHHFLTDGRIRLDNNLSEQALRNLAVGEANWTFFANETGLRWYTTFRSLIASCALHRLNPEIYLEQLLRIVPHWPKSRALELAPKYWLDTVSKLEGRWRAMLVRPWEPDVLLSAKIEAARSAAQVALERAA